MFTFRFPFLLSVRFRTESDLAGRGKPTGLPKPVYCFLVNGSDDAGAWHGSTSQTNGTGGKESDMPEGGKA